MNIFPDYKLIHNREGVISSNSIFYFRTPSSVLGTVLTLKTKKEKKKKESKPFSQKGIPDNLAEMCLY